MTFTGRNGTYTKSDKSTITLYENKKGNWYSENAITKEYPYFQVGETYSAQDFYNPKSGEKGAIDSYGDTEGEPLDSAALVEISFKRSGDGNEKFKITKT
jgi:hypothetical protein